MMGLLRFAVRTCAVEALGGKTIAGDRVRDSEITPLDEVTVDEAYPIIVVYTDDETHEDLDGWDLSATYGTLQLIIEASIATGVEVVSGEGPGIVTTGLPATDEGLEASLDMMMRQIKRAFLDPDNPWAKLLREFVVAIKSITVRRGADEKGIRYAARQIVLQCDTLADAPFAVAAVPSPWDAFVALLKANVEEYGNIGEAIEAEILTPAGKGLIVRTQWAQGWPRWTIEEIGLGSPIAGEDPPDPVTEWEIGDADHSVEFDEARAIPLDGPAPETGP